MKKIGLRVLKSNFIIEVLISITAGLSAYFWSVFFTSEQSFLDLRMQAAAWVNTAKNREAVYEKIVIVTVPENVLIRYNHPDITPRKYLASLVSRVSSFGPAAIGLDYVFDQPSEDPAGDASLKRALSNARNAIIGYPRVATIRGYTCGITDTLKEFLACSRGAGFLNTAKDRSGVVRAYDLAVGNEASLAHELVCASLGLPPARLNADGSWLIPQTNRDHFRNALGIPQDFYYRPMLVNYRNTLENLFIVYDGDELLSMPDDAAAFFRGNIEGKIVIIGDTGYGRDLHKTPFSAPDGGNDTYGVLIQANVLKNLFEKEFIIETPPLAAAVIVIAAALLSFFICSRMRFFPMVLTMALFMLSYTALSFLAYLAFNIWLPVVLVLILSFLTAVGVILMRVVFSETDNERADVLLSRNIAPAVIRRYVTSEPGSIFSARQEELTLLSCYVKNIPQASDRNTTQKINDFINYYYGVLKEVIFSFEGCFNRLPLNGALAIWNVPLKDESGGKNAVRTALEIRDRLSLINRKGRKMFEDYREISIDIAIHKGRGMMGYFGPEGNQDYTAIGDPVDEAFTLAAGFSGDEESWIVITEEALPGVTDEKIQPVEESVAGRRLFRIMPD